MHGDQNKINGFASILPNKLNSKKLGYSLSTQLCIKCYITTSLIEYNSFTGGGHRYAEMINNLLLWEELTGLEKTSNSTSS